MATRGLHNQILYRTCDSSGKTVDDEVENHSILAIAAGLPIQVPVNALHKLAPGVFMLRIEADAPSIGFLGSTTTEGLSVETIPMVNFDYLPHRPVGAQGGMITYGPGDGQVNSTAGAVSVNEVLKNAIGNDSFRQDAIDERVIAENAFHDTVLAHGSIKQDTFDDSVFKVLRNKLIGGDWSLDTDELGRVKISQGRDAGQIAALDGLVSARVFNCVRVEESQISALCKLIASLVDVTVKQQLQDIARKSDIPAGLTQEDVAQAIDEKSRTGAEVVANREAVIQLSHEIGENSKKIYEELLLLSESMYLESQGVKKIVQEALKKLDEPLDANIVSVCSDQAVAVLLHKLFAGGDKINLHANLAGDILGEGGIIPDGCLEDIKHQIVSALTEDPYPEKSGVPGARSSLADKIIFSFMCHRNEIRKSDDKLMLMNDGGTACVGQRKIEKPDGITTVEGKMR